MASVIKQEPMDECPCVGSPAALETGRNGGSLAWQGKSELNLTSRPTSNNASLRIPKVETNRGLAPRSSVPGVGLVPSGPRDQFRSGLRQHLCQQAFTYGSGNASTETVSLQRPTIDGHHRCPPDCYYACSCLWSATNHWCPGQWRVHRLPCPWTHTMPSDIVKPESYAPLIQSRFQHLRGISPVDDRGDSMRQNFTTGPSVEAKPSQSRSEDCSFPEWNPEQERLQTSQAMREFGKIRSRNGEQSTANTTDVPSFDHLKEEKAVGHERLSELCQSSQIPNSDPQRSESPGLFVQQDDLGTETMDIDDDSLWEADSDYGASEPDDPEPELIEEDPQECCCPIDRECPKRLNNLIDCRTLVLDKDWRLWFAKEGPAMNQEMEQAVIPAVAEFMTEDRVRAMLQYCRQFERHQPGHTSHKTNFWRMVRWARDTLTHSVTQEVLDSTQILPRLDTFLKPAILNEHTRKRTPQNVLEDLTWVYDKWTRGDLLADATRGLRRGPGGYFAIPKGRPGGEHKIDDNFYGHGHLVNGYQCGSRAELARDGVHGAPVAGICGNILEGARSVVMGYHDEKKKNYYADIDQGELIWYMGTALKPSGLPAGQPTEATNEKDTAASRNFLHRGPTNHTKMLLKSIETRKPVRVIRSYKLAKIVKHKPVEGYRYDGLYKVTRAERLKKDRQIYRFRMKRLRQNDPASGGQGPLRGVRRPALQQ